jgi:hypothetical protein
MSYKNYLKDDFETPGNYFLENDDTKMEFSEEENNTPTGDLNETEIEYEKIFDNTKFETNQDYETDESIFRQSSNDFCPAPPQINTKHDDCNDFGCPETPEGQGNLFRNSVVNINEINYNCNNCNNGNLVNGSDYCVNLPTPSFSTVSTPSCSTNKKIKFNVVSLQNLTNTKNEKLCDDETININNNNTININNTITKFPILQNTNTNTNTNTNNNNNNTINSDFDTNKITTNSNTNSNNIKKKFSVSLIKYQNPTRRFKPDSIRKKNKISNSQTFKKFTKRLFTQSQKQNDFRLFSSIIRKQRKNKH